MVSRRLSSRRRTDKLQYWFWGYVVVAILFMIEIRWMFEDLEQRFEKYEQKKNNEKVITKQEHAEFQKSMQEFNAFWEQNKVYFKEAEYLENIKPDIVED